MHSVWQLGRLPHHVLSRASLASRPGAQVSAQPSVREAGEPSSFELPWDVLHPGRSFAAKLTQGLLTQEFLQERLRDYLAGKPLRKLPMVVEEQQALEREEAEDMAMKSSSRRLAEPDDFLNP